MKRRYLTSDDVNIKVTGKMMGGSIVLDGYKSAVTMEIVGGNGFAWLRGRDFDRLIRALKKAKEKWKAAGVTPPGREAGR